jgi:glycyl-tRNA synthetase
MPRGENAPLPESQTGVVISLADKIDNLIGCFSVGLKPTSSSDPYALRRQVLGMIKILIQGRYFLSLKECLATCIHHFPFSIIRNKKEVIDEILSFISNRVKTVFQEYGLYKDEIEASLSNGCEDIYDMYCKVQALHEFRQNHPEQFKSLYEVYKRTKGLLTGQSGYRVNHELLTEHAEKQLYYLLEKQMSLFKDAIAHHNYKEVYALIATMQPALAALFNDVKILGDDPKIRENRLGLLQSVFDMFAQVLDFSKIQERS